MKYKDWITEESLKQVEIWASQRLTNKKIMELIGIRPRTFYYWIKKYPEFERALHEGRKPKPIDLNVYPNRETRKRPATRRKKAKPLETQELDRQIKDKIKYYESARGKLKQAGYQEVLPELERRILLLKALLI